MKKHIWIPILSVIALWIVIAGGSLAAGAYSKSLNASINIIDNPNFSFYSDQAGTQEVTQLALPDVSPGNSSTFTVYVKNTSKSNEIISVGTNSISAAVGTLLLTFNNGVNQVTLAPNAVSKVNGTMQVLSNATVGQTNFSFMINSVPTTGNTTTTNPAPTTTTSTISVVSYSATIQPLLNQNCNSCHPTNGINLSSYTGTKAAVGSLPGMGSNYLSASQEQTLETWISQGSLNN